MQIISFHEDVDSATSLLAYWFTGLLVYWLTSVQLISADPTKTFADRNRQQ